MWRSGGVGIATLLLVGCGGAAPATGEDTAASEGEPDREEEAPMTDQTPAPDGSIGVRLALDNPRIPAMTSPATATEARLDATLFVRGAPGTSLTFVLPVAHELDWTLTAADGERWEPTFLPPPVPRPGGPPTTTVTIPESGEVRVGVVHGISGFRRTGADDWQEGLPAGTYEVRVSGFDLGDGARRAAPPVTLTVR